MLRGFNIIPGSILDLSIDSKKTKEEMEEQIRKDFEKETKISHMDFVLKNEKAFEYLLEHYTENFSIDDIPYFQQTVIRIGRYTLIFDKWFIEKEETFFKLQKFNFLWKNKKSSHIGFAAKKEIELENKKLNKNILIKNPDIKLLLENQSVDVNKMIAVEELSELQKEICKDLRGFDRREEIKEEMADVYICLQLLKEIYNFNDEELEEEYKRKMDRNIKRIKVKNKELK